jgi:hypothetical protein
MNAVFGRKWLEGLPLAPTPVGAFCGWCEESIEEGDEGEIMPLLGAGGTVGASVYHRECQVRAVVGSVGHQSGKCSCFGGTEEDPPGMTRREAARAAMRLARF